MEFNSFLNIPYLYHTIRDTRGTWSRYSYRPRGYIVSSYIGMLILTPISLVLKKYIFFYWTLSYLLNDDASLLIGLFPVVFRLCVKTSLREKPSKWKCVSWLIFMQIKALHGDSIVASSAAAHLCQDVLIFLKIQILFLLCF